MPDLPPVPPGIREIDPDAEAARLAAARQRPRHVLCDEVHQITSDGVTGFVSITVTSTIPPPVLRAALGTALYDVVADQCYPPQDGAS